MTTKTQHSDRSTSTPARQYYRVKDAARALGVSPRTLYDLVEREQIPCRRLATVILLPAAWVERDPTMPVKRR
ncbi:helix-turn-helix domain-containing protein [Cellulomonas sp. NPDC057328]|uniref:helix-turn-helix domain-containing protein n=1 Tax=Cellulomonas sp. NPDC057328 TaxID=3346101 RepID=UPI00362C60F1